MSEDATAQTTTHRIGMAIPTSRVGTRSYSSTHFLAAVRAILTRSGIEPLVPVTEMTSEMIEEEIGDFRQKSRLRIWHWVNDRPVRLVEAVAHLCSALDGGRELAGSNPASAMIPNLD